MRNLIFFLIRHSSLFLFLFYAGISFVLLFHFNSYHQSIFWSSANIVAGKIYSVTSNVNGYFGLRDINSDLMVRNGELEMQLLQTRQELARLRGEMSMIQVTDADSVLKNIRFVPAKVVRNSISRAANSITLNKGRADGIEPEMGVVDHNGIVGIVSNVSEHYAVVISLLNPKLRLSCKVKGSDYFGSLIWDGQDPHFAVLEELPRHVEFAIGDTIITSGYSAVFPEGIMVGRVQEYAKQKNDNFYSLRVELSTDFSRLNDVRVIEIQSQKERRTLESKAVGNE